MEIAQAVASDMEDAAEWETTVARTEPGKEPRYKASMPHWSQKHSALAEKRALEENTLGRMIPPLSRTELETARCLVASGRLSMLSTTRKLSRANVRIAINATRIDSNDFPRLKREPLPLDDSESSSDEEDALAFAIERKDRMLAMKRLQGRKLLAIEDEEESDDEEVNDSDKEEDDDDDDDEEEEEHGEEGASWSSADFLDSAAWGDLEGLQEAASHRLALDLACCRDAQGRTALMLACTGNHVAVAEALLRRGPSSSAWLEVVDRQGFTPLHHCACAGSVEAAQVLLFHGAPTGGGGGPHAPFLFGGHKPAYLRAAARAAGEPRPDDPSPKKRGSDCNGTALYWACKHGQLQMVRLLLDRDEFRGRIDEGANEDQDSPLWAAVYHRHEAIALALLENGADAINTNAFGFTVLEVMRMRGSDSVALVSAVKQAIDCRREREQLRMREEALNESRKRVIGEGEPDAGPGVVLVLVALPDSRKSTMKRRFVLDAPARLLFDATDVFMADKCALDLKDGFHLQVTHGGSKLLKLSVVEEYALADVGLYGNRIQIEVVPLTGEEDGEEEARERNEKKELDVRSVFC